MDTKPMTADFPKGTPGIYYVKPKSEINPTPLPEFQQPPSQEYVKEHYWSFPINVARFRNHYESLTPEEKTMVPEWFNPQAIESAYQYYQSNNPSTEWYNWKKPDNDEMDAVTSQLAPPPIDILPQYDQKYSNYTTQDFTQTMAATQADPNGQIGVLTRDQVAQLPPEIQKTLINTFGESDKYIVTNEQAQKLATLLPQQEKVPDATQQIAQLKQNGTWNQLGPVQQFMLNLNASQFGGAATGALQASIPAAFNLLQGPSGIPGALTAIGMGAGLGQLASGDQESPMTQAGNFIMNAFNVGAETITRMAGMIGQFAGSAVAPEWYGSMAQLMSQLPEAWQAADITYAAAHPFKNEVVVHQLGQPGSVTLQGEEADALKQISNLRNELSAVYEGKSPKTFDEVLYGYKEAQPIVDKYMGKYGLEGAARDMIFQLVADPINFSGVGLAKIGETVAARMGLETLAKTYRSTRYIGGLGKAISEVQKTAKEEGVKAAMRSPAMIGYVPTMDGGLLSTAKTWRDSVRQDLINPSEAERSKAFTRWLTGMVKNENGQWVEKQYTPEGAKEIREGKSIAIRNLFPWSSVTRPESAAKATIQDSAYAMAHAIAPEDVDIHKAANILTAIAHQNPDEMAAIGMSTEKNQFTRMAPGALKDAEPKVRAVEDLFDNTQTQRDMVNLIGEEIKPGDRAKAIADDPQTYYDKTINKLRTLAGTGDKAAEEKLKILEQYSPEQFAEAANTLIKTKAPINEEYAKIQMSTALLETAKDWTIKYFGVKEDSQIEKLAQTVKNMESFMLLFPNPVFFSQNVMNNYGTMFADGMTNWMTKEDQNKLWAKIGARPTRLDEGFGDFQDNLSVNSSLGVAAPMLEDIGKIVKGKSQNPAIENLLTRVKKLFRGGFTTLSGKNETSVSQQVGSQGALLSHNRLARVGVGIDPIEPGKRSMLADLDPSIPDRLESSLNLKYTGDEVDQAAKISQNTAFNPTEEQSQALISYHMDEILKDSLDKAGNNREAQRDAFDQVETLTSRMLSDVQKESIQQEGVKHAQLVTAVQGEQAVPVLRQEIAEKATMNQLDHQAIVERIWSDAEDLTGKKKDAFLSKKLDEEDAREQRFQDYYEAYSIGMARGLGIDPDTTGLKIGIHNGVMNLKDFYNGKSKLERIVSKTMSSDVEVAKKAATELDGILQKELGENYDPLVSPQDNVRKVITERYKTMVSNEEKIQDGIDNIFLEHLLNSPHKAGYNGFKKWLKIQKENRRTQTNAELYFRTGESLFKEGDPVKAQIDELLGGYTMDQLRTEDPVAYRKKWDEFQKKIYTPLWYKNLDEAKQAEMQAWYESAGMAPSTAPKVEKVSTGEKQPFEMTSKEFYKKYRWQHSVLKEGSDLATLESEGFKTGIGPNVWSITERDLSKDALIPAMDRKYATTKGKTVYALPANAIKDSGNGPKVKEGYIPNKSERVTISRDYEPMHEALVRQAIENGETVPENVLAEYPELAKLVKRTDNRFEPLDSIDWQTVKNKSGKDIPSVASSDRLQEVGKLYGLENPYAIRGFIKKHLKMDKIPAWEDVTPQMLKDALSTLTDEEFAQRWVDKLPETQHADMPPSPIISPEPDAVQKVATPPLFEAQNEAYADFVKMVEDMKQEYMNQDKKVYTGGILDDIEKTAIAKGLDPTPYLNAARDYLESGKKQLRDVNYASAKLGVKMRDFTLLNYDDRSKFDHNLGLIAPYSFWYTHSMMNWAFRALDRPGLMASYAKLKNFGDAIDNDPNQPTRLKGKMYIPLPWMPDWMGKGIYFDPMRNVMPIDNFLRPFTQWDKNQTTQYKSAISILNDMIDNGQVTYEQAAEAAKNKSGDLWNTAWAKAGSQMDAPGAMDYATMLISPHMPISWVLDAARGKSQEIGQLPFTRMVQNVTGGLGIKSDKDMFGGLISPEGVNLEAWVRTPLGLERVDKYQDYRIDRQLAVMAAENPEMTDELTKAMIDRSGPLYNEAVQRVMSVNLTRFMGSTLALDFLPEGELDQRKLRSEYAKASDAFANGDTKALNAFFDKHPEYQTQQSVWRDPEQRMKMYLRSQIWEAYNALPDLYKKEAAASLGSLFQDAFLNKETRSYDSIATNTLASWAQSLGANTPKSVQASQVSLNLSSPQDAQLVQNFNDMKDQNFPNLSRIYEYANSLPVDQRDAFLNSQQEVQGFNQMKNQFLSQYPNLADSVNSETNELRGLPASIQGAVYTYRDEKAKMFPNIEQTQSAYFSLTDPVQKSAFMLDHPELERYWNWRGKYAANFPEASPYILSDQNIKGALGGTNFNVEQAFPGIYATQSEYFSYPKGSQGRRYFLSQHPELKLYWDWKGFYGDEIKAEAAFAKQLEPIINQMSAELKNNLIGHFFSGQAISSGARMELQKLYNLNKMGGDFNTFIESLKAGF